MYVYVFDERQAMVVRYYQIFFHFLQDVSESSKIGVPKVSTNEFHLTKLSASSESIILVPAVIAN